MKKEISKEFVECLRYVCNCDCYKNSVMIYDNLPFLAIATKENPMFVFTRFLESCDYGKWRGYDEKKLLKEAEEIWRTGKTFCIKDRSKEFSANRKKIAVIKGDFIILFGEYALPAIQ